MKQLNIQYTSLPKNELQGSKTRQYKGFHWMRIGKPGRWFGLVCVIAISALALVPFYVCQPVDADAYQQQLWMILPAYLVATYIGAPLHELLHLVPYLGLPGRAWIRFHINWYLGLGGSIAQAGALSYRMLRISLFFPILLPAAFFLLAAISLGSGQTVSAVFCWFTGAMTLSGSAIDMYWVWKIRTIGEKGKYYDVNRVLDVVWRKEIS